MLTSNRHGIAISLRPRCPTFRSEYLGGVPYASGRLCTRPAPAAINEVLAITPC
jgi:hypothetical protein